MLQTQAVFIGIRTRTSSKRRFSKYVILDYDIALQIQFVDAEILSSFVSSVVYAACFIVVAAGSITQTCFVLL